MESAISREDCWELTSSSFRQYSSVSSESLSYLFEPANLATSEAPVRMRRIPCFLFAMIQACGCAHTQKNRQLSLSVPVVMLEFHTSFTESTPPPSSHKEDRCTLHLSSRRRLCKVWYILSGLQLMRCSCKYNT
ncbi:hypothetical protein INR49_003398 [Caranx melampygus]|nr:hypothetical protein INR49_003398 [Caranx melampygus]